VPISLFNSTAPCQRHHPLPYNKIIHYSWNFGDPASGVNNIIDLQNSEDPPQWTITPTHIFSAPGTYTVTLNITNHPYCHAIITHQVVILPSVPTAKFVFSSPPAFIMRSILPTNPHFPQGMRSLHGNGTGVMVQGFRPLILPPILLFHIPSRPRPVSCSLVVTNDLGCKDTTFKSVSLDPSPLSKFTQNSQCFGDTVKFTDLSIWNGGPPIASYYWNFGDIGSGFLIPPHSKIRSINSAPGFFHYHHGHYEYQWVPGYLARHYSDP